MRVERYNGFAAWRQLKAEYEPRLGGRHAAMLQSIIAPQWKAETSNFKEKLQLWEVAISRYEAQSGEKVSDALKVAVISRYAPQEVKAAV